MFAQSRARGAVAQRLEQGTHDSRKSFACVFTALHSIADAWYFSHSAFATRYAELRRFAAKDFQT